MTVREYFCEPRGRHNCPACGTRLKLVISFSHICISVLATVLLVIAPATLVFQFSGSWLFYGATILVCAVIFVLPIDMLLDDKWRESAKL